MNIRCLHFDMKAMIPKAEFLPCLLENILLGHLDPLGLAVKQTEAPEDKDHNQYKTVTNSFRHPVQKKRLC